MDYSLNMSDYPLVPFVALHELNKVGVMMFFTYIVEGSSTMLKRGGQSEVMKPVITERSNRYVRCVVYPNAH